MKEREALKLALEALTATMSTHGFRDAIEEVQNKAIKACEEALAQEKALQALHDENERLGLYKDAYEQTERESVRLQCITCGTVYVDGVPPQVAHPEQEPVAVVVQVQHPAAVALKLKADVPVGTTFYTSPPQRTWVGLTDEEMKLIDPDGFEDNLPQMIQQALKEKNT